MWRDSGELAVRSRQRFHASKTDLEAEKPPGALWFLPKFPTQQIREFKMLAGIIYGIRESDTDYQG
jgi:hypothetical protein